MTKSIWSFHELSATGYRDQFYAGCSLDHSFLFGGSSNWLLLLQQATIASNSDAGHQFFQTHFPLLLATSDHLGSRNWGMAGGNRPAILNGIQCNSDQLRYFRDDPPRSVGYRKPRCSISKSYLDPYYSANKFTGIGKLVSGSMVCRLDSHHSRRDAWSAIRNGLSSFGFSLFTEISRDADLHRANRLHRNLGRLPSGSASKTAKKVSLRKHMPNPCAIFSVNPQIIQTLILTKYCLLA